MVKMRSDTKYIHLYTFLVLSTFASVTWATKVTEKSPALSPVDKYRDLFPLTEGNFTEKLLKNKDAWIVIFHNGSVDMQWKTMATHLRGICWVGLIDISVENGLIKQLDIDIQTEKARVYPFGNKAIKMKQWRPVNDQNEAKQKALASLPDSTRRLYAEDIEGFIQEALLSNPARFPVYYLSDEREASGLLKAISVRFEKYFMFGRIVKPTSEELQKLGLGNKYITPPCLYVIVFQDGLVDKINAVEFTDSKNGQMNYTNIMQFLFGINSEFRYQLPGNNQSNNKQAANMEDVIEVEEGRFSFLFPDNDYPYNIGTKKSVKGGDIHTGRIHSNILKDEL